MDADRQKLRVHLERVILRGEFTLKSGKKSGYYLDGRELTLSPEPAALVARIILALTAADDVVAVGGPALGAVPIVGAVVLASAGSARPLQGFMVRPAPKGHGRARMVEGPTLPRGARVFLVEDVTTTGGSVLRAARAAREEYGVHVTRVVTLFDRQEGSTAAFTQAGIPLSSIFTAADFGLGPS